MDPVGLRCRLEEVLAHRSGRPRLRVLGPLERLTGGWASTSVYACHLTAADAPEAHIRRAVLKVYAADDAGTAHALREQQALDFLADAACRVPAVIDAEADPTHLGRPFVLMDHVAGTPFWSAYEVAGDVEARAALVRSFVQPLVALHALDPRPLDRAADRMSGHGAVDSELVGLHRDVAAFARSGLPEVVSWLQERRDEVACQRPVVLHRDYHPWNVVLGDGEVVSVLDWDWQVGDARFDLAWTCMLMQRSGQDAFAAAVREEYERQSGAASDHLAYFEVLTTVRWLLNVLPALGAGSQLEPVKREDFRAFLVAPVRRAAALLLVRTGLETRLNV